MEIEDRYQRINPLKFWNKVEKSSEPDGCWHWKGQINNSGYGLLYVGIKSESVFAHRYSFWLHNGYLTPGLVVMHSCIGTRNCVAPHHLSEGTIADNNYEKEMRGAGNQGAYENHNLARLTWPQVRQMREMYSTQKYSGKHIAALYTGMDYTTINKILNNLLWFDPDYIVPIFDNKHFQATLLTHEIAAKIRTDACAKMRNKDLVVKYGISAPMVTAVVKNKRWYDPDYVPCA